MSIASIYFFSEVLVSMIDFFLQKITIDSLFIHSLFEVIRLLISLFYSIQVLQLYYFIVFGNN